MGGKGSKSGNNSQVEQKVIIQQLRQTINRKAPENDISTLGQQFRTASRLNVEQILHPSTCKINKSLLDSIKRSSSPESSTATLQLLRTLKINVNTKLDPDGLNITVLHLAAMLGKPALIQVLLNSLDIDVNALNKSRDTPLLLAIKAGHEGNTEDETLRLQTITPLLQDKRCHIGRTNFVGASPLSIAVAKGYSTIVKALVSGGRVKIYSPIDLAMAIKLSIIYEREDLVELIMNEMDGHSQAEFTNLLEQNPELQSLAKALKELNLKGTPPPTISFDEEFIEPASTTMDAFSGSSRQDFMLTVSTTADTLASKSTKDSNGHKLHIGDLIEIQNEELVMQTNPRIASELDFIEGIANQRGFVHEIDKQGDIYVDVLDTPYAGHISAKCVKFIETGPQQSLNGQQVSIGYYVVVNPDPEQVQTLAKGHGGWKEEMRQFCGKTGKIRKIDKVGDVFVQFYSGTRHCFNPKALSLSSANDVEVKDINGDWIRKGDLARVTPDEQELIFLQQEIVLDDCSEKYNSILGTLVRIRKLRLLLQYTDAVILASDGISYNINPKCLTYIPISYDQTRNELHVGDSITVLSNKDKVQSLQTKEYGKWIETKMTPLLGQAGIIKDIDLNRVDEKSYTLVKVEFTNGLGQFYLNPKTLILKNGSTLSIGRKVSRSSIGTSGGTHLTEDYGYVTREERNSNELDMANEAHRARTISEGSLNSISSFTSGLSGVSIYDGLQIIARKDLIMKKKLGEGGFGCVTSGSWRGTDCAIKQIRPIVLSGIDYENIFKEARIQYGLKHPNIVQLYGISYENDLWMVMQLVNGMDLHSLLFTKDEYGQKEKVAFSYKLKICLQATNAILYLHDKGFIHNDIKPENLMIERQTGNVYICDFGITRYLGSVDLRTYTQKYTSSFGGTLPYIAPECFQKDEVEGLYLSPTFKSDIWALGAIFIELFNEKYLFPTEKLLYSYKIMNDTSGIKSALKLILDSNLRGILGKTLELSPSVRPSADELNEFFCHFNDRH